MSASFHMAQRTGVIFSGDYSAPERIYEVPEDKFGITRNGVVWENNPETSLKDFSFSTYYNAWIPEDGYQVDRRINEDTKKFYASETIGVRSDKEQAIKAAGAVVARSGLTAAQKVSKMVEDTSKQATTASGGLKMPAGTYNDGSFTYVVQSSTSASVTETGVDFDASGQPTADRWTKFVNDLNRAYDAGTLKKGKAPAKTSSSSSSYTPPPAVAPATLAPVETPFYKAKWFLPAVAGGTVLIVLAIALWPRKKKDSAPVVYLPAPAPVPVPTPSPAPIV